MSHFACPLFSFDPLTTGSGVIIPRGKINQREVQRASVTGLRLHSDFAVEPELEAFIFLAPFPPPDCVHRVMAGWGGESAVLFSGVSSPEGIKGTAKAP